MNRAEPSRRIKSFARDSVETMGYATKCSLIRIPGSRSDVYQLSLDRDASLQFVVKESSPPEIAALKHFREAGIEGVPRILSVDDSEEPFLLLMPNYQGTHGRFGDLHPRVIRYLDRVA